MRTISKLRKDGVDTAIMRRNQNVSLTDGRHRLASSDSWMLRSPDLTRVLPEWLTKRQA